MFSRRDLVATTAVIPDTWCTQSKRDQPAVFQRYQCFVRGWNDARRSRGAVEFAQKNCAENFASHWDEAQKVRSEKLFAASIVLVNWLFRHYFGQWIVLK